jgi:hypothetical protein
MAPITKGSTQDILRNWLACGAPLIETQSTELTAITPGSVGDQYPTLQCSGSSSGDGGTGVSFADVFPVIVANCNACHATDSFPGVAKGFALAPEATAYATLLGADGKGGKLLTACSSTTKPYVTPGSPEQSYLLDKIALTTGSICGTPMAPGPGLGKSAPADAEVIRAWIMAGAPGP